MGRLTDEILSDLKEIKKLQGDHTVELAKYNVHLEAHMARTKQLEDRVAPIESHVQFLQKLVKVVVTVLTILAAIATIHKYLL